MKSFKQFLQWLARLLGLRAPETLDQLAELVQKIEPRSTFDTLQLAESQKSILNDICARARDSRRQRGGGLIVFFTGVEGAEKTNAAEAIANDLGRDLYRVDLNSVISKYIGETEKDLSRLLRAAESADAILLFDEADALFGKRSEVKDAHDRFANIEVNYLLQRLETFKGVVILATNQKENIPDAFLRRLRFVVDFPPG
jgi:SpoVK/Ycf46/Vps4 family AAA+-type ATPase